MASGSCCRERDSTISTWCEHCARVSRDARGGASSLAVEIATTISSTLATASEKAQPVAGAAVATARRPCLGALGRSRCRPASIRVGRR